MLFLLSLRNILWLLKKKEIILMIENEVESVHRNLFAALVPDFVQSLLKNRLIRFLLLADLIPH